MQRIKLKTPTYGEMVGRQQRSVKQATEPESFGQSVHSHVIYEDDVEQVVSAAAGQTHAGCIHQVVDVARVESVQVAQHGDTRQAHRDYLRREEMVIFFFFGGGGGVR